MKFIIHLSRIFAGLVFVFSGFVKAIDPTGFAIKFEEYFQAFHLDFLVIFALPLAIVLSAAELMIGLNLLIGVRMKVYRMAAPGLYDVFYRAYLYSGTYQSGNRLRLLWRCCEINQLADLWKNIILLLPTLIIFFNRKKLRSHFIIFYRMVSDICQLCNPSFAFRISVFCISP